MRSIKMQRITSVLIALVMAISVFAVSAQDVNAASKWMVEVWSRAGENAIYVGDDSGYVSVYNTKSGKPGSIKSVVSSNSSIVKVKKYTYRIKGKKYKGYDFKGLKEGTATLTIKYKIGKKNKTAKRTVTVKPYPNAIKSVQINGKNISLTGKNKFYYFKKYKKKSVKVKVVPADGWKVVDVFGSTYNMSKTKKIKSAKSKVLNGSKTSFAKKWKGLGYTVFLENANNPEESFYYTIDLYRR